MLEVKAVEMPSVAGVSIVGLEGGICAECEFSGYGQDSDYILELYLNKCDADGNPSPVSRKEIEKSQSGSGTASTDPAEVESGVYKASAVIRKNDGGSPGTFDFRDSMLYDVVRNGDQYAVRPWTGTGADEGRRPGKDEHQRGREENADWSFCGHELLSYETVQGADPDQDELRTEVCNVCGETLSYFYVPNSAYASFLKNTASIIRSAPEGEVMISTERWVSFDRTVLEALGERRDLSVQIDYRYEGKHYTVSIPAGANVNSLADENGFCGFRFLDQVFGGREVIK